MTADTAMPGSDGRIARLLEQHPVFDGHNDVAWALRKQAYDLDTVDLARAQPSLHTDIPRLRAEYDRSIRGRLTAGPDGHRSWLVDAELPVP